MLQNFHCLANMFESVNTLKPSLARIKKIAIIITQFSFQENIDFWRFTGNSTKFFEKGQAKNKFSIDEECGKEKYQNYEPSCNRTIQNCRLDNWKDVFITNGRGI